MDSASRASKRPRVIRDDEDVLSLLAWGVEQGWSVSMNQDGEIVFDRPGEDEEDPKCCKVEVADLAPPPFARFVGGFEHESTRHASVPDLIREKKRHRTVFRSQESVPLGGGKRLKLSVRITDD